MSVFAFQVTDPHRFYEDYELSSENCISKLHLSLNILKKLNEMLIDLCLMFFAFLGCLNHLFRKLLLARERPRCNLDKQFTTLIDSVHFI